MDLFTYLMAKNDHNTSVNKDLFSYLLGKGQSGTYQTFTGTSISANNTKKAKMKLSLKGNTSQYSTQGYSLYDFMNNAYTTEGTLSITKLENGYTITNNNSSLLTYRMMFAGISLDSSKNYVISFDLVNTSGGTTRVGWVGSSKYIDANATGHYAQSFTGITSTAFSIYPSPNATITITNLMFYEGTDLTKPYEPYTNGASPNPDYPQPINVVSGDNEVVVCGKNLAQLRTDLQPYGSSVTATKLVVDTTEKRLTTLVPIKPNTKYTMFIENDVGTSIRRWFFFDQEPVIASNTGAIGTMSIGGNYGSGGANRIDVTTTPADAKYMFIQWTNNISTTPSGKVALYEGQYTSETIPPYEPYQSQTYPIYLGVENLWSFSDTYTSTSANQWVLTDTAFHLSKGTYTISFDATVNKTVQFNFKDGNNVAHQVNVETNGTFTTDVDLEKVAINISSANNTISNIQLEVGSKANSYTPYGTTPLELCKIGTYQDYFTKNSDGQWCKYNAIGKYTFTGNETFNKSAYTTSLVWKMYYDTSTLGIDGTKRDGFCNFGNFDNLSGINVVVNGVVLNANTGKANSTFAVLTNSQITGWDDSLTDIEKIALAKNMIIGKSYYYILINPYLSLIEDTTLIEQLDNIQNAMSYKGTTNVNQTNNDLPFEIEAEIKVGN